MYDRPQMKNHFDNEYTTSTNYSTDTVTKGLKLLLLGIDLTLLIRFFSAQISGSDCNSTRPSIYCCSARIFCCVEK